MQPDFLPVLATVSSWYAYARSWREEGFVFEWAPFLKFLMLCFLAECAVAVCMAVSYLSIKGLWLLCSWIGVTARTTGDALYFAVGFVVLTPFRVFFAPIPFVLWFIARDRHTSKAVLKPPVAEDKSSDSGPLTVKQMANPSNPLRDSAELFASSACLVDKDNNHLGFCTLVRLPGRKSPALVTAAHVLEAATTYGNGSLYILSGDRRFKLERPRVIAVCPELDVAAFASPDNLGSVLGLPVASVADATMDDPVKVFTPPSPNSSVFRECSATAAFPSAFRVLYTASTGPGSSGSPLLNTKGQVVGVHVYGSRSTDGKIVNGGAVNFWKLMNGAAFKAAETSTKARNAADIYDEAVQAEEAEEELNFRYGSGDDDLDYGLSFPVKKQKFGAPRKVTLVGPSWADFEDDENTAWVKEADFHGGEPKTPASPPAKGQVAPPSSATSLGSTPSGKEKNRRKRKARSAKRAASAAASDQTPSPKSPALSGSDKQSTQPLKSGVSQTAVRKQSEGASSSRPGVFMPLKSRLRGFNSA